MADINSQTQRPPRALPAGGRIAAPAPESDLIALVELIFFAYRDFTGGADTMLAEYGFGRAHHRVLHFVNRKPGLRVTELLEILKITKQSLARVLKQLVDDGFIAQTAGPEDRRERRLNPTEKGSALARRLATLQMQHIAGALAALPADNAAAVRTFLHGLISEEGLRHIDQLHNNPDGTSTERGNP
jgi:DNA-binding MarR family transcriptional regulator